MAESIIDGLRKTGENPPEYLDWDHLHAHYISGRDIFVSEDKKILKVGCQLKALGIRVMRFGELLRLIEGCAELLSESQIQHTTQIGLTPVNAQSPSPRLRGD